MSVLEKLLEPSGTLINSAIENWLKKGKKVIGYYCPYVPEEIFIAAGMLPFAMRATGSTSTELGDIYCHSGTCSYLRHIIDLSMRGSYNFLDGFVAISCCDHFRRSFDVWRYKFIPVPYKELFLQILSIPYKIDSLALDRVKDELIKLRNNLEDYFKVKVSDDDLRAAIKLCNKTRRLLRELYELRKRPDPPVSGEETLSIVIAATAMPKEDFNRLLSEFLKDVSGVEKKNKPNTRLMVVGSIMDDPNYLKIIEELGGLVVADYLCNGTMYFWDPVDESLPPLEALAKRSLEHISCPRMVGDHPRRWEFMKDICKDFQVDGIISQRLMFCDIWGAESSMMRWDAEDQDIPVLALEREYILGGMGQLRTRVQAFLETIGRR